MCAVTRLLLFAALCSSLASASCPVRDSRGQRLAGAKDSVLLQSHMVTKSTDILETEAEVVYLDASERTVSMDPDLGLLSGSRRSRRSRRSSRRRRRRRTSETTTTAEMTTTTAAASVQGWRIWAKTTKPSVNVHRRRRNPGWVWGVKRLKFIADGAELKVGPCKIVNSADHTDAGRAFKDGHPLRWGIPTKGDAFWIGLECTAPGLVQVKLNQGCSHGATGVVKIQKKVSGTWIDAGVSENTACDKEVTIFPKLKDGDSCSSDGDCTSMLCKSNRCAAKAGSGKPCGKDGECESGVCKNECLESGVLDLGASCVDTRQCKAGSCKDGKCKKAEGSGGSR